MTFFPTSETGDWLLCCIPGLVLVSSRLLPRFGSAGWLLSSLQPFQAFHHGLNHVHHLSCLVCGSHDRVITWRGLRHNLAHLSTRSATGVEQIGLHFKCSSDSFVNRVGSLLFATEGDLRVIKVLEVAGQGQMFTGCFF